MQADYTQDHSFQTKSWLEIKGRWLGYAEGSGLGIEC